MPMPPSRPAVFLASLLAAAALALPSLASASQTLTVQKAGSGEGTVASLTSGIHCGATCSAPFADGVTVTLLAASQAGTQPVQWGGCDSIDVEGRCIVTMSGPRTVTATFSLFPRQLTVTKAGAGTGTVTSSPAGINCGGTCSASFDLGSVTLTATPGPYTLPAQWSGCTSVNGENKCIVTMSAAKAVTATFELEPGVAFHLLTIAKSGNGQGTVTGSPGGIDCGATCAAELITGTQVTLSASPAPGSAFAHWSGGGCMGAGACTTTVNKARTVKAMFKLSGKRTLSVTKAGNGHGTVTGKRAGIACGTTCASQVAAGKRVALHAKAATGSTFAGWSGPCSGTKTCKLTMSEARSVTATFTAPPAAASPSVAAACVVPKLRGKTLKKAKQALKRHHCRLGKVKRPKGKKGKRLIVRSSAPGAGAKRAVGAKVGVRLKQKQKGRR
jgi:Divergent InlB B-repeat domain/PASTA domain